MTSPLPSPDVDAECERSITVPFNPCLAKLRPGEPFFVLLGRDKQAPATVETWADLREQAEGKSDWTAQAREVADAMRNYSGAPTPQSPPLQSADVVEALKDIEAFLERVQDLDLADETYSINTLPAEKAIARIRAALSTSTPVVGGVGTTTSPRTDEAISTKQEAR